MPIAINGTGPITGITSLNTTVSDTELGYLDGVTSGIQSQINTAGGLVLITSQSFSAASTVSINNCFTATYQNYRVVMSYTPSQDNTLSIRLRASGTDATTNYAQQLIYSNGTTVAGSGATGQSAWTTGGSSGKTLNVIDLTDPAAADVTVASGINAYAVLATHSLGFRNGNATAYDGISLIASNGTLTGTLRVYGYRNS